MMTRLVRIAGFAAIAILFSGTAMAQETTVGEVIVEAVTPKTEKKKIENYVETVGVKTPTGQMGRWDREICLNFTNFTPTYENLFREHLTMTSSPLGLAVDPPGCKPQVFIVATPDGEKWIRKHIEENKEFFYGSEYTVRIQKRKVKDFMTGHRPVRWLHVTARVTRDGKMYKEGSMIEGRGRIGSTVRADFSHVIIVLDYKYFPQTIKRDALLDYLTMVTLAQINPDATLPNVPSVLNLFDYEGQETVQAVGLTDYDRMYLEGLYGAKRDAKNAAIQKYYVRRTMEDALIKVSQ